MNGISFRVLYITNGAVIITALPFRPQPGSLGEFLKRVLAYASGCDSPTASPLMSRILTVLLIGLSQAIATCAVSAAESGESEAPTAESTSDVPNESTRDAANGRQTGLQPLDWTLLALYGAGTIALGWYFGRRQKSTEEYFVGSGNMNPLLIGVSLFATLLSTISYLSMPGETLGKGPVNLATMLAIPLVYLIVAFGLLPVYMRQRVTSAYELLEKKLGLGVRLLGAAMFVTLRLVWMSLLIYLAAKAMLVMLGADVEYTMRRGGIEFTISGLQLVVLATGLVAVIYTSLGGLRAVVITDLAQTILLFGGAVLVIVIVTIDMGGFGWFPTKWQDNWDTQPIVSFDPSTRITFVGSILSMLTWYVCTAGGDQVSVQRFMATRDARAARRAYATQLTVAVVVGVTLGLLGFALLGYFQANPGELPAGMNLKANADDVFPRFIAYHLPVGVTGLVVAAMFAAAMSSIDSGVNSITAVVTTDFLDRFGLKPKTDKGHVRLARIMAFVIGGIVVVCSTFMQHVPGNITGVTQKTTNLLTTPIFALFFFALFVPFARPAGVIVGAVCGTLTALVIAFSGPIVTHLYQQHDVDPRVFYVRSIDAEIKEVDASENPAGERASNTTVKRKHLPDPVGFQWIGPIALLVNIGSGTLVCLALSRRRKHGEAPPK